MTTRWLALPDGLSDPARHLAGNLRTIKDEAGLSLADISTRTHYSRASWERWLNGKRLVTPEALRALATMVGVDAAPLLDLLDQALGESPSILGEPAPTPGGEPEPAGRPGRDPARAAAPDPARLRRHPAVRTTVAPYARSRTGQSSPGAHTLHNGSRHQLPADTPAFTGRVEELGEITALAPARADAGPTVVVSVSGMAGIGKTALALRAAHRLRHRFPDGQLYLDLRGQSPDGDTLTTADALDRLLRSLGVAPRAVPRDPDQRATLYRHLLAGTRTLLVLDDAAGTGQVRPLLPAAPGCLVLVTSRRRLTGLDDAHLLALDPLSATVGGLLLQAAAGLGRIPPEDPAVGDLIELCGRLPLALRIAGARLRHRPALRVEDLVEQLRDEDTRLDQFQDEDRDLAAVYESGYLSLPEAEQNLFRHLGRIPETDFDARTAADLAGTNPGRAEQLLESLLDHSLLMESAAGRYRLHGLVRLYARRLSESGRDGRTAAEIAVG